MNPANAVPDHGINMQNGRPVPPALFLVKPQVINTPGAEEQTVPRWPTSFLAPHRHRRWPVTISQALPEIIRAAGSAPVKVKTIKQVVANFYGLNIHDIDGLGRSKQTAIARHIAVHITKKLTGKSFPEIGRLFGDRDHTTIMHSVNRIQEMRDKDPEFNEFVRGFEARLSPA